MGYLESNRELGSHGYSWNNIFESLPFSLPTRGIWSSIGVVHISLEDQQIRSLSLNLLKAKTGVQEFNQPQQFWSTTGVD